MKHVLATLIQNTALLLAIMIVFDLVASRKPVQDQWWCQTLVGVILSGLCIDPILESFRLETVSIFDRRFVLLSISDLSLCTIPTFFTVVIASLRTRCRHPLPLSTSRKEWRACQ